MQITAAMVKELRERTGAGMMECKQALVEENGEMDRALENLRKKGAAKADKKAGRIAADGLIGIAVAADRRSAAMVEVNCETDFVAKQDDFRSFTELVAQGAMSESPADLDALGALSSGAEGSPTIDERCRELVVKIGEKISVRRFQSMKTSSGELGSYLHGGRIGVVVEVENGSAEVAKDIAMHIAAVKPLAISADDLDPGVVEKEREIELAKVADSGKPPEIQAKIVEGRISKYLREVTLLGQPFVKDSDLSVDKYLKGHNARVIAYTRYEVGEGIERKSENFAEEVMAQVRG